MELVPLYQDPKSSMPATQFNMKWVEPAGLVKFDFLGLKTLTTLQYAKRLIARRGLTQGAMVRVEDLPDFVPNAFIAIEDRRFRSHFGVDPIGMTRAARLTGLRGVFGQS